MLRVVGVRTTVWADAIAGESTHHVNDRTEIDWPDVAYPIIRQRDEARRWLTQKSDDLDLAVRWPRSMRRGCDTDICGWRTTPVC
jgi:hypothetical protein